MRTLARECHELAKGIFEVRARVGVPERWYPSQHGGSVRFCCRAEPSPYPGGGPGSDVADGIAGRCASYLRGMQAAEDSTRVRVGMPIPGAKPEKFLGSVASRNSIANASKPDANSGFLTGGAG